jgi:hypothetical protein
MSNRWPFDVQACDRLDDVDKLKNAIHRAADDGQYRCRAVLEWKYVGQ